MGGPISCAFFRTASGCTVVALTTSAGLLGYHTIISLSTVKHTAIMTPVPKTPETSVRFFLVTALLCDDLLHRYGAELHYVLSFFNRQEQSFINHNLYPSISVLDCTDI